MTIVRGHQPSRAAQVATHTHAPARARTKPIRSVVPLEAPTLPPDPETIWSRRWYAVQTWPGREWSPKDPEGKDVRLSAAGSLREVGMLVYVPLAVRWITRAGVKRAVERPLLARYVFVGADRPVDRHSFREVDYVSKVVGADDRAHPIPISNLMELAGRQVAGEFDLTRPAAAPAFLAGDTATISGGPFETFTGTVTDTIPNDADPSKAVEILLRIFGRETITHVPLADLLRSD